MNLITWMIITIVTIFKIEWHSIVAERVCPQYVDPCSSENHEELNDPTRSTGFIISNSTADHDYDMEVGWYRAVSGAGGDMPTEPVQSGQCNAYAPIYLTGSLPTEADRMVDIPACASFLEDECARPYTITIKNCGAFNVYCLFPVRDAYDRFCMGYKAACGDNWCDPSTTTTRQTATVPIGPETTTTTTTTTTTVSETSTTTTTTTTTTEPDAITVMSTQAHTERERSTTPSLARSTTSSLSPGLVPSSEIPPAVSSSPRPTERAVRDENESTSDTSEGNAMVIIIAIVCVAVFVIAILAVALGFFIGRRNLKNRYEDSREQKAIKVSENTPTNVYTPEPQPGIYEMPNGKSEMINGTYDSLMLIDPKSEQQNRIGNNRNSETYATISESQETLYEKPTHKGKITEDDYTSLSPKRNDLSSNAVLDNVGNMENDTCYEEIPAYKLNKEQ